MKYQCADPWGKQMQKWGGEMKLLCSNAQGYEVEITGRGTYLHAIIGKHRYGNYICIPNHDVGCELSDYSDVFWNRERLSKQLKEADAITVAYALCHLKEL
ncbi:DUF6618 family protein [Faecalicatena contorta]|uniref:Uncharacterized protein n=1 Tax=Faecalicatena contorta TaxID=39482 RepID=A0A316A459_9FIRM|nr:DUF6618 family protein [Faecalicatena contorta]PWJ51574.1 hypothetical protein A8805_102348 [Faecalicatena contorta]SUQ13130.1 hypothetical protein SAMN05216529_102348 [Faecalicatena contorta]